MITIADIQEQVYSYGALINAPHNILRVYPSPQPDGTPYIKIEEDKYFYISEEKGYEFERRETKDAFMLLFWLMKNVVFSMASQYELNNRIEKQDSRRLLFLKQLELMSILNHKWAQMYDEQIQNVLVDSPYNDSVY